MCGSEAAPLLALSMGEPAGIGGEIALMAWSRRADALPPFVLIADPDWIQGIAQALGLGPVAVVDHPAAARAVFDRALPVLPISRGLAQPVLPGQGTAANAPAVQACLEAAVALCAEGAVEGLVTLPLHKRLMQEGGFAYPGHTEFLGVLAQRHWPGAPCQPVMMLACPGLRVVPVTVHISVRRALDQLTPALIETTAHLTAAALTRDFGLVRPRLAVAGLNPHAGEDGTLGTEDRDVIAPAVAALRAAGLDVRGPLPADTLFHAEARADYDVALCMLHDQALIPIKTLDFHGGVNVTLGLPFVRTSPDHGTAFGLAGQGTARPDSLMAALRLAAEMARHRRFPPAPEAA
ncbi:4-hydroxythreonine-4-phosphate dehydrogenase PdxA [Pararhodospirillum photometricum]|uniref:4-hydroxythreonine-4-phosphate dehydrogenase n=1 Tax=Pararhodospirillum photometricum DSM 122 TaxID=1150469 RepID=H6SS52_PARPM|nr:4-hydroxythreonine-4-phosphate dehydrogenase PdxA [Pararhodospirillum photometricum]CCG07731.1 4-hydroxythreonine-4-phosphate dehydrogenase [Pararhodospirillum photometricum DSM 122]